MLYPFIDFFFNLHFLFIGGICDSFLDLFAHIYRSPHCYFSLFIYKYTKRILYFASVNSDIWSLCKCDEAYTVSAGVYSWCHVSLCVLFCFLLSKTAYSLELYPRELFEGRVGDDFLQKGFVSDELLGARLSKDLFKVHSQLEVLWISQVIKIWASNPDEDWFVAAIFRKLCLLHLEAKVWGSHFLHCPCSWGLGSYFYFTLWGHSSLGSLLYAGGGVSSAGPPTLDGP